MEFKEPEETTYTNTDLTLVASFDLTPLDVWFESQGLFVFGSQPLEAGTWRANYESDLYRDENGDGKDAESDIRRLIEVVETMEGDILRMWNECESRTFDIGFETKRKPFDFTESVSRQSLQLLAKVGGELVITLYGDPPDPGTCTPVQEITG